jgi:hypothetical protein
MALIADANGDLFGTISSGGAYGYGMVFEIANPGDIDFTVYMARLGRDKSGTLLAF